MSVDGGSDDEPLVVLRRALVLSQAATLVVTWPLWELRDHPPLLPVLPLALPCGVLLLLSLVPVLRWPRAGAFVHATVLALAIALDTTRMTPAPLSIAFLLLTTSTPTFLPLARAHLGALWLWAGIHKLLAPAYLSAIASPFVRSLPGAMDLPREVGFALPVVEILLGALALVPHTRRAAGFGAVAFHVGALVVLMALRLNPGVWAWNLILAVAGYALLTSPQAPAPKALSKRARVGVRFALAVLLVSPALYYQDAIHPSLAHQLYSGATPTTLTCGATGCASDVEGREGLEAFGVPVPPSVPTLRAYFFATCAPEDRWLARSHVRGSGYDTVISEASCPRE